MRGIAGIVYSNVFQVSHLVPQMFEVMKHRGKQPKDIITYKQFEIGVCGGIFGVNEPKTLCAALDGILFNADALRTNLKNHGFHFSTDDDQELIIHAYTQWGPNFVERIDGDFAIALLDKEKEKLFLYRDRFGKKPLYWYQDPNCFIFASELKALMATGMIPQTPDQEALASYLFFGYIPRDLSPVKSVNKLLAGDFIELGANNTLTAHPYWSYSSFFDTKPAKHFGSVIDQIDILLKDAVAERIPHQQSYGAVVSGGLGSASIAYYLNEISGRENIPAFTVGFEGQNSDDVEAARVIAHLLHMNQQEEVLTPDNFLKDIVKIAWYLDEPLADPMVLSIWRLAELSSKNVGFLFSGMGSDELMAGHSRYAIEEHKGGAWSRWVRSVVPYANVMLLPILGYINKSLSYRMMRLGKTNPWQYEFLRQNALFDEEILKDASPRLHKFFDPDLFLHKFYHLNRIKSTLASLLYFDMKTKLIDCYILEYERLTAAHSLNWSTPYLDRSLVEFLAGLPEPDRIMESEAAAYLKNIFKDVFPESFLKRPKRARKQLLSHWITEPQVAELFHHLKKGIVIETGIISERWLNSILESPVQMQQNFRYLWGIMSLEIWFRLFINGPLYTSAPNLSLKELFSNRK